MHQCDTKAEATRYGRILIHKLRGKGWKLRVHENLGWHYNAYKGGVSVYPLSYPGAKKVRYSALVNSDSIQPSGGLAAWTPTEGARNFADPNTAAKRALNAARSYVDDLSAALAATEKLF